MKQSIFFLVLFMMGCGTSYEPTKLQGLWRLEVLEVDGVNREHAPYFLQLNNDGSFAVAKRSGDLRGFFSVKQNQIKFTSEDDKWFNRQWTLDVLKDRIQITGKGDYGYKPHYYGGLMGVRNSKLTFVPVENVPDFQSFADAVVGTWELYKIRGNGESEKISDTWLAIRDGEYIIEGPDHYESGKAVINTRYRKVFFEGQETAWDAWFFGDELRLSNASMKTEYSLRR